MWLLPRQFLFLPVLLFVTAVRAAPNDPPTHGEGSVVFTPAARPHFSNLDPRPDPLPEPGSMRSDSHYGMGYDARHGIDTGAGNQGAQSQQGNRLSPGMSQGKRPQQPTQNNPSAGAGRGGRGR